MQRDLYSTLLAPKEMRPAHPRRRQLASLSFGVRADGVVRAVSTSEGEATGREPGAALRGDFAPRQSWGVCEALEQARRLCDSSSNRRGVTCLARSAGATAAPP